MYCRESTVPKNCSFEYFPGIFTRDCVCARVTKFALAVGGQILLVNKSVPKNLDTFTQWLRIVLRFVNAIL